MVKNPQFQQWSKHIDIQYHWICDQITKETINLELCGDPDQTADILTKVLLKPKHHKHLNDMGLTNIIINKFDDWYHQYYLSLEEEYWDIQVNDVVINLSIFNEEAYDKSLS